MHLVKITITIGTGNPFTLSSTLMGEQQNQYEIFFPISTLRVGIDPKETARQSMQLLLDEAHQGKHSGTAFGEDIQKYGASISKVQIHTNEVSPIHGGLVFFSYESLFPKS